MQKKILYIVVTLAVLAITIPIGISYAATFTMLGTTFEGNSECGEWALKWLDAINVSPYNLDQVQPHMVISKGLCDTGIP